MHALRIVTLTDEQSLSTEMRQNAVETNATCRRSTDHLISSLPIPAYVVPISADDCMAAVSVALSAVLR
jgi:hypothetical protein